VDPTNEKANSIVRATRRRFITGTGIATVGAFAAACGPAGDQPAGQGKASAKVVFMSQAATPIDEERYKPVIQQFNSRAGAVTIDWIQNSEGGGAAEAQAKLITLTAAGTPPDIFWTHAYIAPNLVKQNLTADIMPFIKRDKEFKIDSLFAAPVKDYELDGKQYGLPREATTTLMLVNKELFQKNGVALPTENWTWDDYLKAAQQMTKGDGSQKTWGAAGFGGQGSAFYVTFPKVWQEGGDIVDKARTKFTLHQSPAIEQMQWIADLVTKHRVHPFGSDFPGANIQESWNSGRLGMVTSISVYSNYNKAQFDWDIAHLPRGRTRQTRTASAGHSVTAMSKNKEASWEVLKWLASKPSYEHWAKTGLTLPTHKEVANSPLVINPSQPPKSAKIALDAFAYARSEPISGDWGNVGAEINKAMNEVYGGKTDAKGALSAIVQVVESLLAKTPERK
jgi:multiple sugar transport system substrate-binding protein